MPPVAVKKDSFAKMAPVLIALAAFGYAAAGYFFLLSPTIAKLIPGSSLDLSGARQEVADLEDYKKNLGAALSGYGKLNPDNKSKVSGMVTSEPAVHDLFVQMDAIAAKHGLVLVSIDASVDEKAATASGRKTIRATANVSGGSYQELKAFLSEVETANRIMDVQSVVFSGGASSYSLVFRSYFVSSK